MTKAAIIGPGNIGTDLMYKIIRNSSVLELVAMVGVDPSSDGLAKARSEGIQAIDCGISGLLERNDIDIIFDATSASAHMKHWDVLQERRERVIDLTPAAIGPFVVPPVNLIEHKSERNLNMVTCGGQATVPIVAAVNQVTQVLYAEMVSSISSRSAGPGTRANIDEFTETTAHALRKVGGASQSKALIILNPAEPPLLMRNTVFCVVDDCDESKIVDSIETMVKQVSTYVPGYRLAQKVQFRSIPAGHPDHDILHSATKRARTVVSIYLEVEGAADYLPAYAGNLDIMTSAAVRAAESISSFTEAEA